MRPKAAAEPSAVQLVAGKSSAAKVTGTTTARAHVNARAKSRGAPATCRDRVAGNTSHQLQHQHCRGLVHISSHNRNTFDDTFDDDDDYDDDDDDDDNDGLHIRTVTK